MRHREGKKTKINQFKQGMGRERESERERERKKERERYRCGRNIEKCGIDDKTGTKQEMIKILKRQ